jgi:formylglycine-generating enzyme required for sulfatase activity
MFTKYFSQDLGNDITLEMVAIPVGTFTMGSPPSEKNRFDDESPQHKVNVPPFFMGKYPITQSQWKAIAATAKIDIDLETSPSRFKGDELPVETVNWCQATEFCKRLSRETKREYRLPSEAEWEYACRAGTTTPFYFGETITGELSNYDACNTYANKPNGEYREKTTPVGQFPQNAFGLYDMHGNVWEWCEDDYHPNYQGALTDGSAWISDPQSKLNEAYIPKSLRGRFWEELSEEEKRAINFYTPKVLRGGSWDSFPNYCRSASRDRNNQRDLRYHVIGFRVVC